MKRSIRDQYNCNVLGFYAVLLIFTLLCSANVLLAGDKDQIKKKSDKSVESAGMVAPKMDESLRVVHVLNRFTFGARPGDADRVSKIGMEQWFEQQLEPSSLDDSSLQARLKPLKTLAMDPKQMVQMFPPPQLIRAAAAGRARIPNTPEERAIYANQIQQYRERQRNGANNQNNNQNNTYQNANTANGQDPSMAKNNDAAAQGDEAVGPAGMLANANNNREARMYVDMQFDELLKMSPSDRLLAIIKMPTDERRIAALGLGPDKHEKLTADMTDQQKELLLAAVNPQLVITGELFQNKLLRAIYSEHQLEEVMTDFWFNHFNIFIQKNADRYYLTSYERDAIRPHVLGKFQDLLYATATHPGMMFYLDNWQSVGPDSQFGKRSGQQRLNARRFQNRPFQSQQINDPNKMANTGAAPPPQQTKRGLNENYAREVMELHTLGVDGGYTQQDVTELAKVFTGWTIDNPQQGGSFAYRPQVHQPGTKHVLGMEIKDDGMNEGKRMIEALSHHPATAKFISRKLAMRFVSDTPPDALVERMANTFLKSDGDIKEVLRTMFHSPEFWSPDAYRAKVKTPLEFVVSALRASNTQVINVLPLQQQLQKMGMPLYGQQPPTGYKMTADAWVNSSALLSRMNFALALAGGKIRALQMDSQKFLQDGTMPTDSDAQIQTVAHSLVAGDISKQTRETILKQLNDPSVTQTMPDGQVQGSNIGIIAGLVLGSPEFQRR